MNNEREAKSIRSELGGFFSALPTEIRAIIGCMVVFFVFMAGCTALGKLPSLLESKCWEVQVKEGRVFKINSCKGEVIELAPEDLKKK